MPVGDKAVAIGPAQSFITCEIIRSIIVSCGREHAVILHVQLCQADIVNVLRYKPTFSERCAAPLQQSVSLAISLSVQVQHGELA